MVLELVLDTPEAGVEKVPVLPVLLALLSENRAVEEVVSEWPKLSPWDKTPLPVVLPMEVDSVRELVPPQLDPLETPLEKDGVLDLTFQKAASVVVPYVNNNNKLVVVPKPREDTGFPLPEAKVVELVERNKSVKPEVLVVGPVVEVPSLERKDELLVTVAVVEPQCLVLLAVHSAR